MKLVTWFKEWRAERKMAAIKAELEKNRGVYQLGYSWAMQEMNNGVKTPQQVFDRCSNCIDGPSLFDRGGQQAAYDFELRAVQNGEPHDEVQNANQ